MKTPTGKPSARQIIDGQQRLTTLQLALAAARDLCRESDQTKYSDAFRKLTDNDVPLSEDPDDVFKIWPTNADRTEFRQVMTAGSRAAVEEFPIDGDALIRGAYVFFSDVFKGWLLEDGGEGGLLRRLPALYSTLKEDMSLVVIDLELDDDAQEIFETLNSLGTPLLPADLVKNYLFRLAEFQKEDTLKLYRQHWETFDKEKSYWREEVRQGRLKRARLDLFLNHYLTMMKGEEVVISQMFNDYRDLVESQDGTHAPKHMEHFRSYADVYETFDNFPPESRAGLFFYRLDQMDVGTAHPLLLEIFKRHTSSQKQSLDQILVDLESFLVRRAVCGLTPKNYNHFFAQCVAKLRDKNDDFSPAAIRELLLAETADTQRWPDDEEFKNSWMGIEFYRRVKKATQRMILEAIEAALHTGMTEKVKIERTLQIEHLMPVDWEDHWPLVIKEETAEAQERAKKRRGETLHRIGNLTLLTKKLNPSVSNGPWAKKLKAILKHSALSLNRALNEIELWNEDLIEHRSKDLFAAAVKIWPHPGKLSA